MSSLLQCPFCGVCVAANRIEAHKAERCPKAPIEVIAVRQPKPSRQKRVGGLRGSHVHLPDEPRLHDSPTAQDRQINPFAKTTQMDDGVFYVVDVLRSGGSWTHHLSAECSYCHRTIEVRANGPSCMAQYAQDEACRLALLQHLRTDHTTKRK